MLCFKVEMNVCIPAEQTFYLLSDLTRRKEWDLHYEFVTFTFLVSMSLVANCKLTFFFCLRVSDDKLSFKYYNCL